MGNISKSTVKPDYNKIPQIKNTADIDIEGALQEGDLCMVKGTNRGLFYSNKLCWLYGYPGSGKTWLALQAAKEAQDKGFDVLIINSEDSANAVARRLHKHMGLKPVSLLNFYDYPPDEVDDCLETLRQYAKTRTFLGHQLFIVIDAAHSSGLSSYDAKDTQEWCDRMTRGWPEDTGILVIDHSPKDKTSHSIGPIGSQSKLAEVKGTSVYIDIYSKKLWTPDDPYGIVSFRVDKDREGSWGSARDSKTISAYGIGSINQETEFLEINCTIFEPEETVDTYLMDFYNFIKEYRETKGIDVSLSVIGDRYRNLKSRKNLNHKDVLDTLQVRGWIEQYKDGLSTFYRIIRKEE